MADRFPLLLVGALLLLGAVGAFVFQGAARGEFADALSTYRSEPSGARALYLLAEESGIPVLRRHEDLAPVPAGVVPVLLGVDEGAPAVPHDGPDAGTAPPEPEPSEDDLRAGSVALLNEARDALLAHVERGGRALVVLRGAHPSPLLTAMGVTLERADPSAGMRSLTPAVPSPYLRGVERVEARVAAHLTLPRYAVPLLVEAQGGAVVAAEVPHGSGQLVILSAPELAENVALPRADNAQLWLSLLGELARDGKLAFDEHHHGFTQQRSVAGFGRRYGLHLACAQLLFGLVFWAAALRRFGRARPPEEETRASATDALESASRILREGKHHPHAAELLFEGLSAELARAAGLPAQARREAVAEALRAKGRDELAQGYRRAFAEKSVATSDRPLLQFARTASALRAKLSRTASTSKPSDGAPGAKGRR